MAAFDRLALAEFDTLSNAGNRVPAGITMDAVDAFVSDISRQIVFAYDRQTRARRSSRDFNNLISSGNLTPSGLTHNGVTMFVGDTVSGFIHGYDYGTGLPDPAKNIQLEAIDGSTVVGGLYLVQTSLYVVYTEARHVAVYDLVTKLRVPVLEFSSDQLPPDVWGVWGNGTVVWFSNPTGKEIACYERITKARRPELDFTVTEYRLPSDDERARSWRYVIPLAATTTEANAFLERIGDPRLSADDRREILDNAPAALNSPTRIRRALDSRSYNNSLYADDDDWRFAGITCNNGLLYGLDERGFVSAIRARNLGGNAVATDSVNYGSIAIAGSGGNRADITAS